MTKEKAGNQGFGTPGAGGIGGRRGGKGDGLGDKENGRGDKGNKGRKSAKKGKAEGDVLPTTIADLGKDGVTLREEKDKDEGAEHPFELNNLKFVIPQGAFVAIIGRVGCGKVQINLLAIMWCGCWLFSPSVQSSVLQALIGEMRRTRGEVWDPMSENVATYIIPSLKVRFGGNVSYAPQVPWIRNATLRENILFGQPDDEDRFVVFLMLCLESNPWFWFIQIQRGHPCMQLGRRPPCSASRRKYWNRGEGHQFEWYVSTQLVWFWFIWWHPCLLGGQKVCTCSHIFDNPPHRPVGTSFARTRGILCLRYCSPRWSFIRRRCLCREIHPGQLPSFWASSRSYTYSRNACPACPGQDRLYLCDG